MTGNTLRTGGQPTANEPLQVPTVRLIDCQGLTYAFEMAMSVSAGVATHPVATKYEALPVTGGVITLFYPDGSRAMMVEFPYSGPIAVNGFEIIWESKYDCTLIWKAQSAETRSENKSVRVDYPPQPKTEKVKIVIPTLIKMIMSGQVMSVNIGEGKYPVASNGDVLLPINWNKEDNKTVSVKDKSGTQTTELITLPDGKLTFYSIVVINKSGQAVEINVGDSKVELKSDGSDFFLGKKDEGISLVSKENFILEKTEADEVNEVYIIYSDSVQTDIVSNDKEEQIKILFIDCTGCRIDLLHEKKPITSQNEEIIITNPWLRLYSLDGKVEICNVNLKSDISKYEENYFTIQRISANYWKVRLKAVNEKLVTWTLGVMVVFILIITFLI